MAVEFDHEKHKQLWRWLALNPDQEKYDWPGWKEYKDGEEPENLCFACDAVLEEGVLNCAACPLQWPEGGCMVERSSPFSAWRDLGNLARWLRLGTNFAGAEKTLAARSQLALVIAELPLARRE